MDREMLEREWQQATNADIPTIARRLEYGDPVWVRDLMYGPIFELGTLGEGPYHCEPQDGFQVLHGKDRGSGEPAALRIRQEGQHHVVELWDFRLEAWHAKSMSGIRLYIPRTMIII